MKELIKRILESFFVINTGVTIGAAAFITFLQKDAKLGVGILWQIIIVSLLTALSTVIMHSKNELSKKQTIIRLAANYIIINVIVLCSAYIFNWFEFQEPIKVLGIIIVILFVFVFVWTITYKNDCKVAEMLNKKLNERNKDL